MTNKGTTCIWNRTEHNLFKARKNIIIIRIIHDYIHFNTQLHNVCLSQRDPKQLAIFLSFHFKVKSRLQGIYRYRGPEDHQTFLFD